MTLEPEQGNGKSTTQIESLFTAFCRKPEKGREKCRQFERGESQKNALRARRKGRICHGK